MCMTRWLHVYISGNMFIHVAFYKFMFPGGFIYIHVATCLLIMPFINSCVKVVLDACGAIIIHVAIYKFNGFMYIYMAMVCPDGFMYIHVVSYLFMLQFINSCGSCLFIWLHIYPNSCMYIHVAVRYLLPCAYSCGLLYIHVVYVYSC